jgi:two-component system, NarL family, response regulator LiaR
VDDQPGVLAGLRMQFALEPDIEVVGDAQDGEEAISQAQKLHPDVIVMDARMPNMDGIEATEILRRLEPHCCVVILSLHDDTVTRTQARMAGAMAFVAKHESPSKLFDAVRQAAGFFPEN